MTFSKRLATLATILTLALATGCIMAGKQVFFAIKGSSGDIAVRKPLSKPFGGYQRADIARFSNQVGDQVPKTVSGILESEIQKQLAKLTVDGKPAFQAVTRAGEVSGESSMPTLEIRGYISQYEEGSGAGRATGFTGANKLWCEVEFADKTSGEVLLQATITGIRKSDIGHDESDTAIGVGKGVAEAIEKNWKTVTEDYTKVVPREEKK